MMNSPLATTMQNQRTSTTSSVVKRSSSSRNLTPSPPHRAKERRIAPPLCAFSPGTARSEALLAVEDEGDGLLDAQPLRLLADQPRHRFDERRLVGRDDLGEVRLERLQ